ncbi:MAG: EAL domain-containing protein [Gammaproteobacteria bacterium]|nr:EAL domain-containing protein [Gammaproteobacteria bacterium]NIR85276.1 EAL domain-containing protein [Gammaproteobacteria bacterium]NIR88392.1 EAL domain-containing protein [Gammaproteobacteria bacterium]NIU06342.1 EAL domain-containing protein [Gammaproteobacteria bacterium]NIV53241.1 EAL domain-containing protein [Gammaproteobacteria bacterium]
MTLSRQLLAVMLAVLLLAFGGIFLISVETTRQYLNEHLEAQARNAASSLGASLSSTAGWHDPEELESTVDAVFDGGGYGEIFVSSLGGERVVHRSRGLQVAGVPQWFVDTVPLLSPPAQALIASPGPPSRVSVTSNPADAYRVLWRSTVASFRWCVGTLALGTLLVVATLRYLLRPLSQLEGQAQAISERRFGSLEENLPAARDLRRVVVAMKKTSDKVRRMLNEQIELAMRLREEAYTDRMTGSGNRRSFEQRLAHMLGAPDEHAVGALVRVRLQGMEVLNRRHGRPAEDEFLRTAAIVLRDCYGDGDAFVARVGGGEFGVLMNAVDAETVRQRTEQAVGEIAALRHADVERGVGVHIGVSCLSGGRPAAELFAETDAALHQAQQRGLNQWQVFEREDALARFEAHGTEEWRAVLQTTIDEGGVVLMYQAVESTDLESVTHYEVLARIRGKDERLVPAGVFMPMAERVGLASALERVIVEMVIEDLTANSADRARHAVNLSSASLGRERFGSWLCKKLARANGLAERLAFEAPERSAHLHLDAARRLSTRLREVGAQFGVDHFGMGAPSFSYLEELPLDYVKIDGSYINGLDKDRDDRFFVRSLIDLARLLDIDVIAEFVETENQLRILRELGVGGVQGYFVVKPQTRAGTDRLLMGAGAASGYRPAGAARGA